MSTTEHTEPSTAPLGTSGTPVAVRINQWVVVVAGVLGILAASAGLFGFNQASSASSLEGELEAANREIGSLRSDKNGLERDLSAANADNAKLQADNEQLHNENEALRAGQSPADEPPEAPGAKEPIRHQGEVTLADGGDRIDLNAPSTDPGWQGENSGYDYAQLRRGELELYSVDVLPLQGESASFATCSTRTGYGPPKDSFGGLASLDPAGLDGDECFRLSNGRYARILLKDAQADRVTLSITTWENE